jgi:hypothetical protein
VIKSVGAYVCDRRARRSSESRTTMQGCCREALLLLLLAGVKRERHVLGGRQLFLAAPAEACAMVGGRETARERESACMSIPALVSSLDSTNAADLPQPTHAIQSHPSASLLSVVGALPLLQGCPADCSSSQVLSFFYSFACRRRLCILLKSVDTIGCTDLCGGISDFRMSNTTPCQ